MKHALQISALVASAFFTGCTTTQSVTGTVPAPAKGPAPVAGPAAPLELPTTLGPSAAMVATPPPLSKAAAETVEHLTQPVGGDALPHEKSDTSSFPEAAMSLQLDAVAPKFEFVDARSLPPVQGLTADGNSTTLIVRDWTGLVLVPISASLSKAHTSSVRLLKVEAHPLRDGRVRIWIRVQNVGRTALASDIACSFRMQGYTSMPSPNFYELQVPARSYRDVFFVSPEGQLNTYTVLVRPTRE